LQGNRSIFLNARHHFLSGVSCAFVERCSRPNEKYLRLNRIITAAYVKKSAEHEVAIFRQTLQIFDGISTDSCKFSTKEIKSYQKFNCIFIFFSKWISTTNCANVASMDDSFPRRVIISDNFPTAENLRRAAAFLPSIVC